MHHSVECIKAYIHINNEVYTSEVVIYKLRMFKFLSDSDAYVRTWFGIIVAMCIGICTYIVLALPLSKQLSNLRCVLIINLFR